MKSHPKFTRMIRSSSLLISLFLALAVFAAPLPQPAMAATTCATTYVVQTGDTTPKIAHRFGFRWRDIAKANNLPVPTTLTVGQKLCIPVSSSSTTSTTSTTVGLSVVVSGTHVKVVASNPSVKSVYVVKIRDGSSSIDGWYKLGRLKVGKNKSVTTYYPLPKQLNGAIYLQVCLKNVTTDELFCRTVVHQY